VAHACLPVCVNDNISTMIDNLTHIKQSFDKIAGTYDNRDNQNAILQWMRGIVHNVYLKHIPSGSKVLELNAGTGVDALFLASKGMTVYATDISEEMINVLKAKVKSKKAENEITAEIISFDEIEKITETGFDATVSNFGGLNCINDFSKLSGDLAAKLNPRGKFIAVVMNKYCPWEMLYYMLRLDFRNAFRRLNKNGVMAELNGNKVLTFYFTPKEFAKKLEENFSVEKIYTLGYNTPPPYLAGIYNKVKPVVKLFMKIDELIKGIFPFNRLGDHFILVMKKK
jgi:ubiquinone/menaquinone biosynthesis C-methylase UbiE